MDGFREESFQLVNMSFLRLKLAIYCRNCLSKECDRCEIDEIKFYLDDPGRTAGEGDRNGQRK